jgi:hypothetical protein
LIFIYIIKNSITVRKDYTCFFGTKKYLLYNIL